MKVHTVEIINQTEGFDRPPAYTERDIIDLMVRAPACPDWFEPDMSGFPPCPEPPGKPEEAAPDIIGYQMNNIPMYKDKGDDESKNREWGKWSFVSARYGQDFKKEESRRRLAQWPRAYAKMVLEAK
ncbi:MAG: hypothetical protein V4563_17100 [Pseudomonadota bacterium]